MGEGQKGGLKLHFNGHLRLEFRGAKVTSDAGLLAVRELDEMMGLSDMAADLIEDKRTGENIQHQVSGLLRQSVYARLAGYEDTNDHKGLSRDPAMRAVIGTRALEGAYEECWLEQFTWTSRTSNETGSAMRSDNTTSRNRRRRSEGTNHRKSCQRSTI